MSHNYLEYARRILAVRLDNIGDVIMLGPALRALRQSLPQAAITLLASPGGSQAALLLPWVDDVLVWRAVWQDISGTMPLDPERELELVKTLRDGHYDAAFIFTSFSQSPYPPAYACYLAGIPIRIGHSKEFGGGMLTLAGRVPPDSGHQVDRNLALVKAAGLPVSRRDLELRVESGAQQRAGRLLEEAGIHAGEDFIVLAPGASCEARRYDPARFASVAHLLAVKHDHKLVVIGSERERATLRPVLEIAEHDGMVSLVGRTSVPELAGVIQRSSLVVANNSASLHLADAFRKPMVILYSGTEHESQWMPRSAPAVLLRRPTECSPCFSFRCPYHMECLDISPEEVVQEITGLFSKTANGDWKQPAFSATETLAF